MIRPRVFLLTILLLLAASALRADPRQYTVRICNNGQLTLSVAIAYQDETLTAKFWAVHRWISISPGSCDEVFSHVYDFDNGLGSALFAEANSEHLHLAFAFTDATGTWGGGTVNPAATRPMQGRNDVDAKWFRRSNLRLCVAKNGDNYRVDGNDPVAACKIDPALVPLPASIDYNLQSDVWAGVELLPTTLQVGFGSNDRAIPLGRSLNSGGGTVSATTPQGPSALDNIRAAVRQVNSALVRDSIRRMAELDANTVANFSPQWIGDTRTMHGTISRVVEEPTGTYAIIYFTESAGLTVCISAPQLQFAWGRAYADKLVGRLVEFTGRIVQSPCLPDGVSVTAKMGTTMKFLVK